MKKELILFFIRSNMKNEWSNFFIYTKKLKPFFQYILEVSTNKREQPKQPNNMSSIENRVAELEEQVKSLMEKLGTTKPKSAKKEKSSTNKDGSPKKKRGTTGYLMFAKETRPEAKDFITTDENPTPKPTEVVTEIAKRWKALEDEERASWNDKAKVANEAD